MVSREQAAIAVHVAERQAGKFGDIIAVIAVTSHDKRPDPLAWCVGQERLDLFYAGGYGITGWGEQTYLPDVLLKDLGTLFA